jgi:hypothetical protein
MEGYGGNGEQNYILIVISSPDAVVPTGTPKADIVKALIEAKKRGIKIEVVLDKRQRSEKYSSADFVAMLEFPFISKQSIRSPTTSL